MRLPVGGHVAKRICVAQNRLRGDGRVVELSRQKGHELGEPPLEADLEHAGDGEREVGAPLPQHLARDAGPGLDVEALDADADDEGDDEEGLRGGDGNGGADEAEGGDVDEGVSKGGMDDDGGASGYEAWPGDALGLEVLLNARGDAVRPNGEEHPSRVRLTQRNKLLAHTCDGEEVVGVKKEDAAGDAGHCDNRDGAEEDIADKHHVTRAVSLRSEGVNA